MTSFFKENYNWNTYVYAVLIVLLFKKIVYT
jgi:hypothetical protein